METGAISPADDSEATQLAPPPDWASIVEAHQHTVLFSVLALGLRWDRAQEITQRAFARLYEQERAGKLDRLSFPGLAIRQARFLALDAMDKDAVEKRAKRELSRLASAVEGPPSAERRLLAKEQLAIAIEALTYCPPSSQRVFRAVYEDPSAPHAVIAERLGLSVQRVRQILCEVRRRVRDALEEAS